MYIKVAIALAVLLLGFSAGWKTNGWRHDAALHAAQVQQQRDTMKRIDRIDEASVSHESFKAKEESRYVERVKIVREIVERPVYRNTCIDPDGMRLINSAIRGEDTSEPKTDLPGSSRTP
jgi:hypothetical protein